MKIWPKGVDAWPIVANFDVYESDIFLDEVKKIRSSHFPKILQKLKQYFYPQLSLNPFGGPQIKALKNWAPSTWRLRIGEWRFFYRIDMPRRQVWITGVRLRRDAYR